MEQRRITELLAPAGELEGVIGAINAGADAVYLGAPLFSARAYAKNLSQDEILDMIKYAHLFHRKIYLTMNILLKNREMKDAIAILEMLYEAGLDAVIIQDLGLLHVLSECFPELELHVSTQMAIMSKASAEMLKRYHVTRIVPARELSLKEIEVMKHSGLEMECFIHGAMCYSYSGRCLMSSLAGGRSGNRGRCAGTCRQKYHTDQCKECYMLSMKDMCSIQQIGELIAAGIDSFKIEGRMKAPEYSAGVTAIYRKYIDMYAQNGSYVVSKEDMENLKELYIRSEIQEGYYYKHNGREMISLNSPSYKKISEEKRTQIKQRYINERKKLPIEMRVKVEKKKEIEIEIINDDTKSIFHGNVIEEATKRAISSEDIEKQLKKTGNTNFEVQKIRILNDNESFIPISVLNDCRRNAIRKFEDSLISKKRKINLFIDNIKEAEAVQETSIRVGIQTQEQLDCCLNYDFYDGIILPIELIKKENIVHIRQKKKLVFLRLPDIIREQYYENVEDKAHRLFKEFLIDGVYCNCLDAIALASNITDSNRIIADYGVYVLNKYSENVVLSLASSYTLSFELNAKELSHATNKNRREIIIYSRIPVMFSANCIAKTTEKCDKSGDLIRVYDEKNHVFIASLNHDYCYNTIYNCTPLSLHNHYEQLLMQKEASVYRIEFSIENEMECKVILDHYSCKKRNPENLSLKDYTNGHYSRGVI